MGTLMLECGCSISTDMFQRNFHSIHIGCDCKKHKDVFELIKMSGIKCSNLKRPRGVRVTEITFTTKGKKK